MDVWKCNVTKFILILETHNEQELSLRSDTSQEAEQNIHALS